jgi:hypothetical protein
MEAAKGKAHNKEKILAALYLIGNFGKQVCHEALAIG